MHTIQTTIGQLVDAEGALQRLAEQRLDAKTRYHVVKLAHLVAAETRPHFHEPRRQAIAELGLDPGATIVPMDKRPAFLARMSELAAVPVTLPWGPVTSRMVEGVPDITAADLLALGPLFALEDAADEAAAS